MAWPAARVKTFTNGGSFTPAEANAIQDQYIRATGILADDLDEATVAKGAGLTTTAAAVSGAKRRRGLSVVQQEQSILPPALTPTKMPTADEVQDIVVETNGLLLINVFLGAKQNQAVSSIIWLFLNESKVNVAQSGGGTNTTIFTQLIGTNYQAIMGNGMSLDRTSNYADLPTAEGAIISLGNGWLVIDPGAGTWDVSIRYEGDGFTTISAKERYLYVESVTF